MTDEYGRLLEAWKVERREEGIQSLPDGYLPEMNDYISRLRGQTGRLDHESLRNRIMHKERENAERMFQELFELRTRKIILSELNGAAISTTVLTAEEKQFHANLRLLLAEHSKRMKSILVRHPPRIEAKPRTERGMKVVRFLKPLPAIIGIDMKTYGPFKAEDVASIPEENAENLIRRGIAKGVEISE